MAFTTIIIIVAIILLMSRSFLFTCYKYYRKNRRLSKLPQFKGHFFLGNLELLTGNLFDGKKATLYETSFQGMNALCERTRNFGVFLLWIAIAPYVMLTNANAVEQLLSSQKIIDKALEYDVFKLWLGTGLLTSGPDKWRRRRKFLTPAFHFRILNDFIPIINKHSRLLVQKLKKETGKLVNIFEHTQLATLDVICETAMGVCINAQASPESRYVNCVMSIADLIFNRFFQLSNWFDCVYFNTESGKHFKESVRYLHNFTYDVINTRKKAMLDEKATKNGTNDISESNNNQRDENIYMNKKKKTVFMDLLIKRHLEGLKEDGTSDFTLEDIREEVDTFMFEGFDTTSAALTWTLHLMGNNPHVQEKAYEEIFAIFGDDNERQITEVDLREMKYLECCIKEALRLYPSVPVFARKTTEKINICGFTIPRHVTVFVYAYGLHRDPTAFPEPEEYIPERFISENCAKRHPFAYIPFSAGPRNCIGQKFALMELKIAVAEILRNFKLQSLKKKITVSIDVIIKPREPVFITFTPRNP